MANQGLAFSDAGGGNRGYNGLWIGNVTTPFGGGSSPSSSSLLHDAFYAAQKDDVLPTVVNVAAGVPILSGSLLDEDGVSTPQGVVVTITKPDGTVLNTSSSVYTDDLMIHLDAENNLSAFMIKNPAVGNWTVTTQIPDGSEPNFQLFISTMPTGTNDEVDMQATLQSAFQEKFTAEQLDGFVEKFGLLTWRCFWCQVGVWALAIIIVIAVTALGTLISIESGAVVSLGLFLTVSAARALLLIRSIIALVTMGVNKIITSICGWSGACSAAELGLEAENLSPQGGY
jgi:hypothetical protein